MNKVVLNAVPDSYICPFCGNEHKWVGDKPIGKCTKDSPEILFCENPCRGDSRCYKVFYDKEKDVIICMAETLCLRKQKVPLYVRVYPGYEQAETNIFRTTRIKYIFPAKVHTNTYTCKDLCEECEAVDTCLLCKRCELEDEGYNVTFGLSIKFDMRKKK